MDQAQSRWTTFGVWNQVGAIFTQINGCVFELALCQTLEELFEGTIPSRPTGKEMAKKDKKVKKVTPSLRNTQLDAEKKGKKEITGKGIKKKDRRKEKKEQLLASECNNNLM